MKSGRETNWKEHAWRVTSGEKVFTHVSLAPLLALGPKAAQKELVSAACLALEASGSL